jgi:hypothetical protein
MKFHFMSPPLINAVMAAIMTMMKSANIANSMINSASRVVDTLRMCKYFNNTYCRNSLLQKLLNTSKSSLSFLSLVKDKFFCAVSHLPS